MPDDDLLGVAGRIADGEMLDWVSITSTLNSDQAKAIAEELALVQQIAAGHRQLHQLLPVTADTPPHLMPDRARWGHLDLLNVVGRGSYGMVYRAWDTRLERLVALKLFHGASNPDSVMQEGRMLARVRNENVVTVYGADVFDGVAGIWMELIHGQTLDQIVRKDGPLSPNQAAAVGADVSRALGAVHAAGLLHCDVKAQNVVRETTGRVVLMDLGAGRLMPEAHDSDQLSDVAGTPRYMAPELFAAGATASKPTDIYSLGVLIYYLVSGEFPVDGKTLGELKRAHEKGAIRTLSSRLSGVPKTLQEIVARTLDRDPVRRPASASELQDALAALAAAPPEAKARTSPWWWILAAFLAAVVAFVLIRPLFSPASSALEVRSIAVLPIKNLTGDPSKAYLAEGLTEVLVAHLARLPGLQVASSAMMAAAGASDDERALASKLGVRLLLAGSVLQADSRIALSVRLIDPREGRAIWGSELERQPSAILTARSEIASLVAARLSVVVPVAMTNGARRQLKPDAQDAFLRALVKIASTSDQEVAAAVELLTQASSLEPTWAEPLAYLAYAQQMAIQAGDPAERHQRAETVRANALHAIQIDPSLPMSYAALAAVQAYQDWDFPAAESTLQQGLDVFPGSAPMHDRLALLFAAANRLQEAVKEAEVARDLEPLIPERHTTLGIIRYYARDYVGALAAMQQALTISANYAPGYFGRGRVQLAVGRHGEAIDSITHAIELAPNPGYLAFLGLAFAMAGRDGDLRDVEARLRSLEAAGNFASIDNNAYIAASQGRNDEAFKLLDEAVNRRMSNVLWLAVDPRADPLRSDPRFGRLVARIGVSGK